MGLSDVKNTFDAISYELCSQCTVCDQYNSSEACSKISYRNINLLKISYRNINLLKIDEMSMGESYLNTRFLSEYNSSDIKI